MPPNLLLEKEMLNDAFITWYNSRYKELIASELLERWQMTDTVIQIGIAATAAGSAIAGWQVWTEPGMKIVWSSISGMVSLMALGHKGFRVVDRVKVWGEAKQAFTMIKDQMETLRYEIKMSFEDNKNNINKQYLEIRKSFSQEDKGTPNKDLWLTRSLENKIMDEVYNSKQKTNFEEELKLSRNKYLQMKAGK